MKTLGVLVFTPTHLVSAFAAMKTKIAKKKHRCVVIICRFPSQRDSDAKDMSNMMHAVIAGLSKTSHIVQLSDEQMAVDIALGRQALIRNIRKKVRWGLDEIYYAHDYVGILHQCLCLAYPGATRVSFGDGLGYIISRPDLHKTIAPARIRHSILAMLRGFGKVKRTRVELPWSWENIRRLHFKPDWIYVMMPVEIGYRQTRDAPLRIVPVETVQRCLRTVSQALGLREREDAILSGLKGKEVVLLLMANLSESAMSTPNNEINLYMSLIEPHLTPGCSVIVKPHPGSADTAWRLAALRQRLGKDIGMVPFPDDLKRYPLELFENLVCRCKIAAFSSFLLAARLLFDIEASSGLTADMATAYINHQYLQETLEDLDRHSRFDHALRTWDHRSTILSSPEPAGLTSREMVDVSFAQ